MYNTVAELARSPASVNHTKMAKSLCIEKEKQSFVSTEPKNEEEEELERWTTLCYKYLCLLSLKCACLLAFTELYYECKKMVLLLMLVLMGKLKYFLLKEIEQQFPDWHIRETTDDTSCFVCQNAKRKNIGVDKCLKTACSKCMPSPDCIDLQEDAIVDYYPDKEEETRLEQLYLSKNSDEACCENKRSGQTGICTVDCSRLLWNHNEDGDIKKILGFKEYQPFDSLIKKMTGRSDNLNFEKSLMNHVLMNIPLNYLSTDSDSVHMFFVRDVQISHLNVQVCTEYMPGKTPNETVCNYINIWVEVCLVVYIWSSLNIKEDSHIKKTNLKPFPEETAEITALEDVPTNRHCNSGEGLVKKTNLKPFSEETAEITALEDVPTNRHCNSGEDLVKKTNLKPFPEETAEVTDLEDVPTNRHCNSGEVLVKVRSFTGQSEEKKSKKKTLATRKLKKKCWWQPKLIRFMLIMHILPSVCGAAFHNELNVSNSVFVQPLLLTRYCNRENLYTSNDRCQTNEVSLNRLIKSCEFEELCHVEEKPICVNIQESSVFVCLRKELKCPKGYRLRPWVDDNKPDDVNFQKEKCPDGTYQLYESDCIHACLEKHRDLENISERYIVHSLGDNVSPAKVYCNYKKGFYNGEGQFLLDYDMEEIFKPYFCDNINDIQPCQGGQFPLPNGSCVGHCQDGFERNAPDFVCTQKDTTSSGSNATPASPLVTRTSTPYDTSTSQEEVTTQKTDEAQNNHEDETSTESPSWENIVIGVIGGGFGGVIVTVVVWLVVRKRDSRLNECRGYQTTRTEGSDEASENRSNNFQDSDQSVIITVEEADDQSGVATASDATLLQSSSSLRDQNIQSATGPRRVENNHSTKIGNQSIIINNATSVTIHNNKEGLSSNFVESEVEVLLPVENGMDASEASLERQENGHLEENGEEESPRFLTNNSSM